MPRRDGYSNYSFVQALAPTAAAITARVSGDTIDMRGFDTCVITVEVGAAATSTISWTTCHAALGLEIGLPSALGVSAWSTVASYVSCLLHSVVGEAGAISTATAGVWQSIHSVLSITDFCSKAYAIGFKGGTAHRYIRVFVSHTGGNTSVLGYGATAVLGRGGSWPVNATIGG